MTSAPWSRIRPAVGSSKPAIIRSVVVLPEPGRAEHREELAVADVEVDAVDGDDVAVPLLDAPRGGPRRRRGSRGPLGRGCAATASVVVGVGIAKRYLVGHGSADRSR